MSQFVKRQKFKTISRFAVLALAVVLFSNIQAEAESKKKQPASGLEGLRLKEGDGRQNDVRALKTELLIATSEKRAIKQINKLIRKYRGTGMEANLHFRLAELYMRRSKSDRFLEVHRKSETMIKMAPAIVKRASSKKFVQNAINTYELIERRFPNFNKMDIVLFNNGFARQQLGQGKSSAKKYWKVVKNHPNSPLVADCHLAIGEIYFDKNQFKTALEHFNAIKKYQKSRVYPYGIYKAGWSYYNLHQAKRGMQELELVVEYGKYVKDNNIDSRLDLRKEALADMTIFYEDVYPAKRAFKYFQKQSGEMNVAPVILRLANRYSRHSRYSDKKVVLTDFIKRLPAHESIPEVHEEMIWNYDRMKDRNASVKQMELMYNVCRSGSEWVRSQKIKSKPAKSCHLRFKKVSLQLAKKWLKIWQKNKTFTVFADSADQAFAVYLKDGENDVAALKARYIYAEMLFQREKYRKASVQYTLVGQATKNRTQAHDSRYAALFSLEKAVGDKWSDKDEKLFQQLAKNYLSKHKKGKFRLDIEYKMALIAYEKGRYEEAGKVFKRIGTDYARTEKGLKSQDLYLDILNLNKNYKELKEYSRHLMGSSKNSKRVGSLSKIYEQSYFSQVQGMEESKNFKGAIVEYKRFAKENSKSPLSQKAWWNAVQLHFKTMDQLGGAEASMDYYRRFPKSKEAVDSLLRAAQTYEAMGQLNKAAEVLIELARVDSKSKLKWQVLAADFLVLEKNYKAAHRIYRKLVNSPAATSLHAVKKLALIAKERGRIKEHKKWLRALAKSGKQPVASLAQADLLEYQFKINSHAHSFVEAKKVLNMKGGSPSAKARARYIQAQILESEFRRQSLKSRVSRVAVVLGLKTEKLSKAQIAYQNAMRYGDPQVTVDSLESLAGLYGEYVNSIRSMPTPTGLIPSEEVAFRQEMENLAIPMEEKSVQTLSQALKEANRLNVHNGSAERIAKKLDKMNMRVEKPIVNYEKPAVLVPGFVEVGS